MKLLMSRILSQWTFYSHSYSNLSTFNRVWSSSHAHKSPTSQVVNLVADPKKNCSQLIDRPVDIFRHDLLSAETEKYTDSCISAGDLDSILESATSFCDSARNSSFSFAIASSTACLTSSVSFSQHSFRAARRSAIRFVRIGLSSSDIPSVAVCADKCSVILSLYIFSYISSC